MKENNIVIVDRNESLPVLKDAKFVYPQLQDKIVDEFLNVQHLASYFVKRKGHQKISTLLYEIDEQGLVQYALGLQEGRALQKIGRGFFEKHFGWKGKQLYLWRSVVMKEDKVYVPYLSSMRFNNCDNTELFGGWIDVSSHRYVFEDRHFLYVKKGQYVQPQLHVILS